MKIKRLTAVLLVLSMMLGIQGRIFAAETLGEVVESRDIIDGVTYTHIQRITTNGWLNINVLKADLNNEHLSMDVLTHAEGVGKLDQTSDLSDKEGVVGAVNGDFFTWASGVSGGGSSIGPEVSNGEILSSTGYEQGINSVIMDMDKNIDIGQFNLTVMVQAPNEEKAWVSCINKYSGLAEIALYNRKFGKTSPTTGEGVIQMLVVDDVVTDIQDSMGAIAIPENGYVLASIVDNRFLADNFSVGDKVKITIGADFNLDTAETMVGGGAVLLENGKVPSKFSHNISGTQPRTALGIDKTGKILYLVTVDGRQQNVSVGVTQTELAYIMAELGAYKAINLDGGGSTTMAIREENETEVVNSVSDGSERAVANAVGIVTDAKPTGVTVAVAISADDSNVFAGTSVGLDLKGYDIYKYQTRVEQSEVVWEVSGVDGYVENNIFYPKSAGEAVLTAWYGENHGVFQIHVLEAPYSMEFTRKQIKLNPNETTFVWLKGYDIYGNEANIYLKDVATEINSSLVELDGNKVTAKTKGGVTLSASFKGVTAYLPIGIGVNPPSPTKGITTVDESYGKALQYTTKFAVFGNTKAKDNLFEQLIMNKVSGALNKEKDLSFSAFVGNSVYKKTLGALKGKAVLPVDYDFFVQDGNAFLTLDNSLGTFMATGQKKWSFIKSTLADIAERRVFIFMTKDSLDSPVENKIFYDLIKTNLVDKGKEVYIFTGDDFTRTRIKNGVHIIGTQGFSQEMEIKNIDKIKSDLQYVVVYAGDEGVSYEFKRVYE